MYCSKCGVELRTEDVFCSRCGDRVGANAESPAPRSLLLDKKNKKILGVCAGFARYLDVDVVLVRVVWLALAFGAGLGFIAYLAAWIVIPSDAGQEPREAMAQVPLTN